MKIFLILCIFAFSSISEGWSKKPKNYCKRNLCPDGVKHIGCENDEQLRCPDKGEVVDLECVKDAIVKAHNNYRNQVAFGNFTVKGVPSPKRMATMTWDDDLAFLATLNVKTCKSEHDQCHNTLDYGFVAQNIAKFSDTSDFSNLAKLIIKEGVQKWVDERERSNNFKIMVAEKNHKIGCGLVRIGSGPNDKKEYLLTCNYATNELQEPETDECKTGKNPKFPALCSEAEKYDTKDHNSKPDYCASDLCPPGVKHVGCNHSGAVACGDRGKVLDLASVKDTIADVHNYHRNQVAIGNVTGIESATRMATMVWDDELAYLAELNVKSCVFAHDQCYNTDEIEFSGQNIAMMFQNNKNTDLVKLVTSSVKMWFSEWEVTNMGEIRAYDFPKDPKIMNGHFTVMSADRNFKVGCGAVEIEEPKQGPWESWKYIMTCNYATTNMMGSPIFEEGPTASKCTTGKNPKYPGLCSVKEKYPVNDFEALYGKKT